MFNRKKVSELKTKLNIEKFVSENKGRVIEEIMFRNKQLEEENRRLKRNEKSEGTLLYREGSTPFGRKYISLMKIIDGEYQEIDTFENTKQNLKLIKAAGFISNLEYTLKDFSEDKIKDTGELR